MPSARHRCERWRHTPSPVGGQKRVSIIMVYELLGYQGIYNVGCWFLSISEWSLYYYNHNNMLTPQWSESSFTGLMHIMSAGYCKYSFNTEDSSQMTINMGISCFSRSKNYTEISIFGLTMSENLSVSSSSTAPSRS